MSKIQLKVTHHIKNLEGVKLDKNENEYIPTQGWQRLKKLEGIKWDLKKRKEKIPKQMIDFRITLQSCHHKNASVSNYKQKTQWKYTNSKLSDVLVNNI